MPYFKALRPDRKSFYDGTTEWKLGEAMPVIDGSQNGPCGPGYHLGKSLAHAIRYAKFPMALYEAEPCGTLLGEDDTKARFTSAKIVREVKKPSWVIRTETFIASINDVKWLDGHGKPKRAWKMFETRDAAWVAARVAARDAAWDAARVAAWVAARAAARAAAMDAARVAAWVAARVAARDAAWVAARDAAWVAARDAARVAARDACLMAYMEIVSDLKIIDKKHRKHAKDRWAVWQAGYGLLCDMNGELYCYKKV